VDALADVEIDVAVLVRRAVAAALAAAISPPERGRAGAYDRPGHHLRGQGEAEVRRDRGGGQAEGHHQKVEGAGAELGGDGDSRRDPPPGCR
jgi:hypothetical protein